MALEISQLSTAHAPTDEPRDENVEVIVRLMANSKAVELYEPRVEGLKLGINNNPTVVREFHQVITWVCAKKRIFKVAQRCDEGPARNEGPDGMQELPWS